MEAVAGPIDERAWRQVADILLSHDRERLQGIFPDRFRIALANHGFDNRLLRTELWRGRGDLLARVAEDAFDDRYGTFQGGGSLVDYVFAFVWGALWETRHRRRAPFQRVSRTRWATGPRDRATAAVDLFVWNGRVLVSQLFSIVPNPND